MQQTLFCLSKPPVIVMKETKAPLVGELSPQVTEGFAEFPVKAYTFRNGFPRNAIKLRMEYPLSHGFAVPAPPKGERVQVSARSTPSPYGRGGSPNGLTERVPTLTK